jgi:hypothetical protein
MIRHDSMTVLEVPMASHAREKFATQVDAELLTELRSLARAEGRQIQALVDEALADLIEKRKAGRPRAHVLAAYGKSHERYAKLYQKLAE